MKKNNILWLILSLALLFLLFPSLISCESVIRLEYKDGVLEGGGENSDYEKCSFSIIAASISTEKKAKLGGTYFYRIPGYEESEFLTQSFDDGYAVIRKKGIEEPALNELKANKIYICNVTSAKVFSEAEIVDKETIDKIIAAIQTESELLPPSPSEFTRELRIASENYPHLYYRISYLEDTRGVGYFYDRATGNCVLSEDLIKEYIY